MICSGEWLTEQDGGAAFLQAPDAVEALALERHVADRERLVDDQDVAASTWIATANARRTTMPLEYVLTGWSMKSPMSANASMLGQRALHLARAGCRGSRR